MFGFWLLWLVRRKWEEYRKIQAEIRLLVLGMYLITFLLSVIKLCLSKALDTQKGTKDEDGMETRGRGLFSVPLSSLGRGFCVTSIPTFAGPRLFCVCA